MRSFYQDRLGTNIGKSLKKDDDFFSQVHAARSLRCFVRGRGAEQYYLAQHIHRHKVSQVTTRFLSFNQITTHNGRLPEFQSKRHTMVDQFHLFSRYTTVTKTLRSRCACVLRVVAAPPRCPSGGPTRTTLQTAASTTRCEKQISFEPFYTKNDRFAKTSSGQT